MEQKNYIAEFKRITSNKFSSEQSGYLYVGLLYELINDRNIFKKNIEIDSFINKVYDQQYKDYLFRSRPYLASRLLSDLNKQLNYHYLVKSVNKIIDYLEVLDLNSDKNVVKENKNKKSSMESDNIIGWFNSVKNSSDTE